jgi:hypothetical protein
MTSTVTEYSSLIDTTFPIPGVDNDTAGFRNNFGNIKTALNLAALEITDLQLIQSALTSITSTRPESVFGNNGDILGQIYADDSTVAIAYDNFAGTTTAIWNIIDTVKASKALQWADSQPTASTGTITDVQGMVYANTNTLYICFSDYISTTTSIWGKVALDSESW